MTKYEKVKNMSVEEMAKEIFDKVVEGCRFCSQKKSVHQEQRHKIALTV